MEEEKKKKVMAEAAEFQPDAIELENHQPPVSMHFAWYIVILAILFLLGWACLTEVDKVVTAEGKITTIRPPITMKPLDRTTIRKVHVKVGQRVQKDELLFTFDQTVNQQDVSPAKFRLIRKLSASPSVARRTSTSTAYRLRRSGDASTAT